MPLLPRWRRRRRRGVEAEAQRLGPVMVWVWGGIGLVVIALFVGWLALTSRPALFRHAPVVAPITAPQAQQHY